MQLIDQAWKLTCHQEINALAELAKDPETKAKIKGRARFMYHMEEYPNNL